MRVYLNAANRGTGESGVERKFPRKRGGCHYSDCERTENFPGCATPGCWPEGGAETEGCPQPYYSDTFKSNIQDFLATLALCKAFIPRGTGDAAELKKIELHVLWRLEAAAAPVLWGIGAPTTMLAWISLHAGQDHPSTHATVDQSTRTRTMHEYNCQRSRLISVCACLSANVFTWENTAPCPCLNSPFRTLRR